MTNNKSFFFWAKRRMPYRKAFRVLISVISIFIAVYFFVLMLWMMLIVNPVENARIESDKSFSTIASAAMSIDTSNNPKCRGTAFGEATIESSTDCRNFLKQQCSYDKSQFACDLWELWQVRETQG